MSAADDDATTTHDDVRARTTVERVLL